MYVLMDYLFEMAILFGDIYISDNEKACLLLKYPHREKVTLKTIILDIKLSFKCIGIERVFSVLKRQHITNKNAPKENYIKPMIMGAKNEAIGKGTAARLIIELKKDFKNTKLPIIINAASIKNVQLYQKFGFKLSKTENNLGFPVYYLRMN